MSNRADKQKLYATKRWKSVRRSQLEAHPLCYMCNKEGLIVAANIVDHIIGFTDKRDPLAHDPDNFISLCKSHHQIITAKYEQTGMIEGMSIDEAKALKYNTKAFGIDGYEIEGGGVD